MGKYNSEKSGGLEGFLWLCAFLSLALKHFESSPSAFSAFSLPMYIFIYTTTTEKKKKLPSSSFLLMFLSSVLFLFPFCYCCSTSLCFCDSFFFGANHSPIFILSLIRVRTTTTKSCCSLVVSFYSMPGTFFGYKFFALVV